MQPRSCFVCGGLMDKVSSIAKGVVKAARPYQFETFSVGVSLPEGLQEREDEVRSTLKIMGKDTAKTQTARMTASLVSEALGKRVDKLRPDLTLLVDLGEGRVSVASRSLFFYARYTKPGGVSQRREFCTGCSGAGCERCGKTGFRRTPSVELLVGKRIASLTGSDNIRFTWIGSEDKGSKVRSPGRPFVVEVKNPVKRTLPSGFIARSARGQVGVREGRVLPAKPLRLPSFRFETRITARVSSKVGKGALDELERTFHSAVVKFDRPDDRPTEKMVYEMSAKQRGHTLTLIAQLDGGLPVKRLVSGELVSPSVSEVLKTEVSCRKFDICGVEETGEFEFAEVPWNQKKN